MINDQTGYHSLRSLREHRNYAGDALDEHEVAHCARTLHARYRSYVYPDECPWTWIRNPQKSDRNTEIKRVMKEEIVGANQYHRNSLLTREVDCMNCHRKVPTLPTTGPLPRRSPTAARSLPDLGILDGGVLAAIKAPSTIRLEPTGGMTKRSLVRRRSRSARVGESDKLARPYLMTF